MAAVHIGARRYASMLAQFMSQEEKDWNLEPESCLYFTTTALAMLIYFTLLCQMSKGM